MREVICSNCRRCKRHYARGVCQACYQRPGVLAQLPPISGKYGRRGVGIRATGLPSTPTAIPPGPEKIEVLIERASLNLALWHPDDARGTNE